MIIIYDTAHDAEVQLQYHKVENIKVIFFLDKISMKVEINCEKVRVNSLRN